MIIVSLDKNWMMKDRSWDNFIPAFVPGDLYSDLLRNDKIGDPYYRDNELEALALSEREYEYRTEFFADSDICGKDRVLLRFEGIDTLADVFLNGELLRHADNMHRIWEFDVKGVLREGRNTLSVEFQSPTEYIRERYAAKRLDGTSDAMRGFPYLRKAHCMFGWDWGPRLPGVGLWRPVSLVAYDTARIDSNYVTQKHEDGAVELHTRVELQSASGEAFVYGEAGTLLLKAEPELCGLSVAVEVKDPEGVVVAGDGVAPVRIENPQLWWPAGFGAQPLYTVRVSLYLGENLLDVWERRIGLSTMTMATEPDTYGERFAHSVNGVEIFAMGADYIPEDNLIARTS